MEFFLDEEKLWLDEEDEVANQITPTLQDKYTRERCHCAVLRFLFFISVFEYVNLQGGNENGAGKRPNRRKIIFIIDSRSSVVKKSRYLKQIEGNFVPFICTRV